jgi:hypothetical protein
MKEVHAGCTLGIKMSLPDTDIFNHYENVEQGYYCGFKETAGDDMTDEQCDDIALTMIARARKIVEDKVDNDIHNHKDVKVFSTIKKG